MSAALALTEDVDLHTRTQINFLPTSTERLSISPALLFTKGQTQRGNSNATERKSKTVNVDGVTMMLMGVDNTSS